MRIFCSICKDIFIPYSEVHVTKCGHLYHDSCISTWIKQHKTCPQCRSKTSTTFRVFFDVEKDSGTDPSTLEHELEVLSDKLREAERQRKNVQENYSSLLGIVDSMKECALSLTKKNDILKTSVKALKGQVTKLTKQNESVAALESEVDMWKSKVATLERIEAMVKGSAEETNKLIAATPVTELAVKQLCIYVGVLKSQLVKLEEKNLRLTKENKETTKALALKTITKDLFESEEVKILKENNSKLENELRKFKMLYEDIKKKHHTEKTDKIESQHNVFETKVKRPLFEVDLDFDDSENMSIQCINPVREDKTINHWEKLICAGPSRNVGLSLQKSKFLNKSISSANDSSVLSSLYAFDGMGGRKKLRLGCPTPAEEFEKIRRTKDKKSTSTFQQNLHDCTSKSAE